MRVHRRTVHRLRRVLLQISVVLTVILCLLVPVGEAVLGVGDAVYDFAIHFESLNQTIAQYGILANTALDLTPIDEMIADAQGPIALLGFLVNMACHPPSVGISLSFRLGDICSAFDQLYPPAERVPDNSYDFALWQAAKEEQTRQSAATAARSQALIEHLGRDSESLIGLLESVLSAIGGLSGLQTQHQISAQHTLVALRAQAIDATFQRAVTTQLADEATTNASLRKINRNFWSTWPGMEN